ncbi:MAG: tetratricopeptide repeat protein [Candidatus Solibacter usitatus]|nr:tetratricopeptide repeat protein [Candidatus Solibacter usitatus]
MRRCTGICCLLIVAVSCNRDPEVRKAKYLERGNKYMDAGRLREASILYRRALKLDPRYGAAYYRLGLLEQRQDRWYNAGLALRRAAELLPEGAERVDARIQLADILVIYLETMQRDSALLQELDQLSQELLDRDPKSYQGHCLRGRWAAVKAAASWEIGQRGAASEHRATAIEEFRIAGGIRPGRPEVLVPLARCLWDQDRRQEAEKLLLDLVATEKHSITAYSDLARYYGAEGRAKELEQILIRAEQDNSAHYPFAIERAVLYHSLKRDAEAVAVLEALKRRARDYPDAYQAAGDVCLRIGKPDDAIRQYEEGIRAIPREKLRFRKLIVQALLAQGKSLQATRVNESILKEFPEDIDSLVLRSATRIDAGDLQKAIAELAQLERRAPDNAVVHYHLGRAQAANGQRDAARLQFAEASRYGPRFLPPRIALAGIEMEVDEWGRALALSEEILTLDRRSLQGQLIRAQAYRGMKKYPEARAVLRGLMAAEANSADALLELGRLEEAEGRPREAEAAYRASYAADPRSLRGLQAITAMRTASGDGKAVLRILQQEIEKAPDRNDLRAEYADTALRLGLYSLAEQGYKELMKRLSGDAKATGALHLRLGEVYGRSGDPARAIEHLEKARQILPAHAVVLNNLAVAYEMAGRRKEAAEYFEASLKENDDNGVALNNLACYILDNGGDVDRALTLAQRARQKLPDRPEITDTIGWIYYHKNLLDSALEIFEKLSANHPKQPSFRYHLGAALLKKGDRARARKELQQALASQPSADEAQRIRALLERM